MGVKVQRKGTETVLMMVRRLKKLMEKGGVFRELRDRANYQKPSEIRRRKELRRHKMSRLGPQPPKSPPVPYESNGQA